jgi:hypothetical protein
MPTPVVLQVPVLPPQYALMQNLFFRVVKTLNRHCVSNTDKHAETKKTQRHTLSLIVTDGQPAPFSAPMLGFGSCS